MPENRRELPIFELPMVLMPGEPMPLHIFERRYRQMVGEALDADERFGIVFRDDEGGARSVGCTARVTEVTERFEDGRFNVVVTGESPFRVLDRFEAAGYPAAEVELIDLDAEEPDPDEDAARSVRVSFCGLLEQVGAEPVAPEDLAGQDAYGLAGRIELPDETKQRLLELRSEGERMRVLDRALSAVAKVVERSQAVAEHARTNGRVVSG